ncbi:MAG: hypothetical protein Fur0022_08120 [Anaerolineales bacterium]
MPTQTQVQPFHVGQKPPWYLTAKPNQPPSLQAGPVLLHDKKGILGIPYKPPCDGMGQKYSLKEYV